MDLRSNQDREADTSVKHTEGSSMAGEDSIRRISEDDVALDVGKMDVLNYAMYLNNIPPINNIRIQNLTH